MLQRLHLLAPSPLPRRAPTTPPRPGTRRSRLARLARNADPETDYVLGEWGFVSRDFSKERGYRPPDVGVERLCIILAPRDCCQGLSPSLTRKAEGSPMSVLPCCALRW